MADRRGDGGAGEGASDAPGADERADVSAWGRCAGGNDGEDFGALLYGSGERFCDRGGLGGKWWYGGDCGEVGG